MEGLAALDLVRDVLHVILFSSELVAWCKQVHHDGSAAVNDEVKDITTSLG